MVLDYFTINDCGCASLGAGGSEDARVRLQWVRAERRNDRVSDGEWKPNMQVLEAAFNRVNTPWHPVAVHRLQPGGQRESQEGHPTVQPRVLDCASS